MLSDTPQFFGFCWRIIGHVTCLDQSRASENRDLMDYNQKSRKTSHLDSCHNVNLMNNTCVLVNISSGKA